MPPELDPNWAMYTAKYRKLDFNLDFESTTTKYKEHAKDFWNRQKNSMSFQARNIVKDTDEWHWPKLAEHLQKRTW